MRKRRGRKPLSWYVTWIVLLLIVIAMTGGFVLSLPVWRVKSVLVRGSNYLSEAKIVNTAMVPRDENIFLIDLEEIKSRYSKIVQIKAIKIKRKLPDTIVIEIKERKPYAIAVISGVTSLIDDEGYVIARQNLASSMYGSGMEKYPVIRGINRRSLEGGIRLNPGDRAFVRSAIDMLSNFMDPGTIQIEASNWEDIIIYIEDILKVKIGDPKDIERKIRLVRALLGSVKGKWTKVAYMDVRVPDNPVIKFR
jgi:cell division protein FtsQ